MVVISIKEENIVEASEKHIAHLCNCNSKYPKGITKSISEKYRYANPYLNREEADKPGSVIEFRDRILGKYSRIIISLMGQWAPGKPYRENYYMNPNKYKDNYKNRRKWFKQALETLDKQKYDTVAMPFKIGCDSKSGGKWKYYLKMLNECKTKIILYKS